MPLEVAERAVQFLKSTIPPSEVPKISFYGGEPLLHLRLLQHIVEYARNVFTPGPVHFNMTTNGTVMSPAIAQFLADNDITLLISLDGPKCLHDRYRTDRYGQGSYDRVTANVSFLKRTYPHYFQRSVLVNLVLAPPLDLSYVNDYLKHEVPVSVHRCTVSLVDDQGTDFLRQHRYSAIDETEFSKLRTRAEESFITGGWADHPLAVNLFKSRFLRIAYRSRFDCSGKPFIPTGQCFPGGTKLFIDTAGRFHLCERISDRFIFGDVNNGIDETAVRRYCGPFFSLATKTCASCYALRLCNVCLQGCLGVRGFSQAKRRRSCSVTRSGLRDDMKSYLRIIEGNPKAFDEFSPIVPQRSFAAALRVVGEEE